MRNKEMEGLGGIKQRVSTTTTAARVVKQTRNINRRITRQRLQGLLYLGCQTLANAFYCIVSCAYSAALEYIRDIRVGI